MLKTGLTDSLCDNESFAFPNLSEEIGEVAVGVEEKKSVCCNISKSSNHLSRTSSAKMSLFNQNCFRFT